jgi:hypothetical protein
LVNQLKLTGQLIPQTTTIWDPGLTKQKLNVVIIKE